MIALPGGRRKTSGLSLAEAKNPAAGRFIQI